MLVVTLVKVALCHTFSVPHVLRQWIRRPKREQSHKKNPSFYGEGSFLNHHWWFLPCWIHILNGRLTRIMPADIQKGCLHYQIFVAQLSTIQQACFTTNDASSVESSQHCFPSVCFSILRYSQEVDSSKICPPFQLNELRSSQSKFRRELVNFVQTNTYTRRLLLLLESSKNCYSCLSGSTSETMLNDVEPC